jgi:serine/threonine protein kinase/Tfp pilus assembly protein PilF
MQLVEGQTLRDLAKDKKLGIDRIIELVVQLCDGLSAAHDKKVVHRDIKPSNIVIDAYGRPKILDFGLATIQGGEQLTKTGSTLGTIRYMSPEQVQGKQVDHRSDLFSLGVVLYELITGRTPFEKDNEGATLQSITQDNPEPLSRYKSDIPDELQRTVSKLLEKDPSMRYQTAGGVLSDLKRLTAPTQSSIAPIKTKQKSSLPLVIGGFVVIALLAVVGMKYWPRGESAQVSSIKTERKMLAVLPFENLGNAEDESFSDGITDAITSRIAKISGLGVIARTSVLHYKGTTKRISEIGAELGVEYVLEGTILWDKSNDTTQIRIIPQLIQVSDESHIWTETYERALTGIFAVQANIATSIAENLDVTLLQPERAALENRPTDNMEAYQAFLAGNSYGFSFEAAPLLEKAVQLDPSFALAYARLSLSQAYTYHMRDHTEEQLQKAKQSVDRALELQPSLPEAHLAMGYYHYWGHQDYKEAIKELDIAEKSLPNDPYALGAKAYIWRRQGRLKEAVERLELAFALNPKSSGTLDAIIETYLYLRDFQQARWLCDKGISKFPGSFNFFSYKFWSHIHKDGNLKQAQATLSKIPQMYRDYWLNWDALLYLKLFKRDYNSALDWIDSYQAEYLTNPINFLTMTGTKGLVYRYMGDSSSAITAFDSALTFLDSHKKEYDMYNGYHSELGLVYAGLGRKEEAIREGKLALDLMPISKDAFLGAHRTYGVAQIYVMVGEYENAVALLDTLMIIPFIKLSIHSMKLDPHWDPLRDHPHFKALLEKYGKIHGQ